MADPGFPASGGGGRGPRRGSMERLRFENFICQNERIATLRGCAPDAPPRSADGYICPLNDMMTRLNLSQIVIEQRILNHAVGVFPPK